MLDHYIKISSKAPYVNDKEDGRREYVFTVYNFIDDSIIESINDYCIKTSEPASILSNIENLKILIGDKDSYFDYDLVSYCKEHKSEIDSLKKLNYNICLVEEVIENDILISIVVDLDFPDFSSKDITILQDEHFEYLNEDHSTMVKRFSKNQYRYTNFSSDFNNAIKAVINYFESLASDPSHKLVLYCPKCGMVVPGTIEYTEQDIDKNYLSLSYKKCTCGGDLVEIDELMIDIVKTANKNGYTTLYCCSGHSIIDQIYITFLDKPSITRNIIKRVSEDISIMEYFDIGPSNNYHGISIQYFGDRYFDGIGEDYRTISYDDFVQHRAKVLRKLYELIDMLPNISQEEKEEEK